MGFEYDRKQLIELLDRNRPNAPHPISAEDLAEFLRKPELWRRDKPRAVRMANGPEEWMQFVFQDMGLNCEVPPIKPGLTEIQRESLRRFRLRLFCILAITEEQFPPSFVKPNWSRLDVNKIERRPLPGKWVAVETIRKPDWNDPEGYRGDQLAPAVGLKSRFNVSWDDLHQDGLLKKIARETGFPKKSVRLPTAEEWNFLANLMNWLRENRGEDHLPDLGSTDSWEWCENICESGSRLLVGDRGYGGLAGVGGRWHGYRDDHLAFRVLAVL